LTSYSADNSLLNSLLQLWSAEQEIYSILV